MMFIGSDLVGEQNLPELLTTFQPKPPKRGRPFPLEDWLLFRRRRNILGEFEYHWSEVGWELQHARTLAAIRNALKPLPATHYFELFLCEDIRRTTPRELHELQRAMKGLTLASRDAYQEQERAKERLERAEGAVKDIGEDARLLRFREERNAQFLKANQHYQEIVARIDVLKVTLRKQAAYIAQSELLDFIGSKRYTLCPQSFANAMAGLPEISWRVSANRCREQKAEHPYPFHYELFLEVARALAKPASTVTTAVEQAKEYLQGRKIRNRGCAKELCKQWYFLSLAVEATYTAKPRQPRGAEPYRVFAEYMRRTSCISRVDEVLAEEMRLNPEP